MKKIFDTYQQRNFDISEVNKDLENIRQNVSIDENNLKKAFSFIDLTSLNSTDTKEKIASLTAKVNEFPERFPSMPKVAGICVYPNFVEIVKNNLTDKDVAIVSVAGGFPSSQTFINIKTAEIREAIYHGAQEVDIVISVGEFIAGEYAYVFHELKKIRKNAKNVHLKVILETGLLPNLNDIYKAAILAMEAGADFIKTSTGKEKVGATPEAVYVMSYAVLDYYNKTERKVGIKPAGGVSSAELALYYMEIVKTILGEQWLNKHLFRIGTSSLANKLLIDLRLTKENYF